MRHRKSGKQLNRNASHRKAMFKNMACSLMEHEVIKTTVPKAKELRRFAEPLITLAKQDSVANRRLAFSRTGDKAVVGKLFTDLGPRFQDRPGGYTRILKAGFRAGDCSNDLVYCWEAVFDVFVIAGLVCFFQCRHAVWAQSCYLECPIVETFDQFFLCS